MVATPLHTTTGITSRPITKLYPLELNEAEGANVGVRKSTTAQLTDSADSGGEKSLPERTLARKAKDQVKEWVRILLAPQNMSWQKNCRTCN